MKKQKELQNKNKPKNNSSNNQNNTTENTGNKKINSTLTAKVDNAIDTFSIAWHRIDTFGKDRMKECLRNLKIDFLDFFKILPPFFSICYI